MNNMFYGEEMNMAAVHRAAELKGKVTLLFAAAIVGLFLSDIAMLVYGGVLIAMGKAYSSYKTAGLCLLGATVLNIVSGLISEDGSSILSLPAAVLSLAAIYIEIQCHAEVLVGIDDEQSTKWLKLWKYMVIAYAVLIGSIILVLILLPVGTIVALCAAIALIITSIMKIVYLYRMDNTIKNLV